MRDPLDIARSLEDMAVLLALSGENAFKVRAYERAAQVVAELGGELPALIAGDGLTAVEGIGPSLARQIGELYRTGSSPLFDQLRREHPPGMAELARVPGLTVRRIRALREVLGIDSVDALRDACLAQRVRTVPGFGPKTEQRLLGAIERLRAPAAPERLLLADALELAERIAGRLRERVARRVEPAGAVRRCEETAGALDLVVACDDEAALFAELARLPQVARVTPELRTAQLVHGIALRLHLAAPERFGAALIEATGPSAHVQALLARARERGLEGLPAHAGEADVYRALDAPFVPPELRGADGAFAHEDDFADLVSLPDVRGFVHCHTTYSDGKHGIEEMARAAAEAGMEYITITDHSPSAHYARGVEIDRLMRQWDEIAEVQERVPIRILRGAESDILADGALDYPDAVLERLDVVIASIHSRFKMDRAEMTQRLTRAMSLPVFKIWGHALGRLLLSRDPIDCDVEAVIEALAGSQGAIEVNGDPRRLDLPPSWIPLGRKHGVPFVLSVDAHSTAGFGVLKLAVAMARRGGLRKSEVLNTLPAAEFADRVKPVKTLAA